MVYNQERVIMEHVSTVIKNHTWSLCEEHASDLPYFGHDLLLKQTMDPQ